MVIAFMDDLMFLSRIREAARPAGVEVKGVRKLADLVSACAAGGVVSGGSTSGTAVSLLILDLDTPRIPVLQALAALREAGWPGCPVVGFLGHELTQRTQEARDAGCTEVYARGAFVRALPALLHAAASASAG